MSVIVVLVYIATRRQMAVVSVQKNLLDHVRQCKGVNTSVEQLKITQCLQQKAAISGPDLADVKRKEVAYCIDGYQSCTVDT